MSADPRLVRLPTPLRRAPLDAATPGASQPLQFVLKVAARCNLNCSYCYVFNKADQSWRDRSRIMSDEVLSAALQRIARHSEASAQGMVRLMFHGGEPMMAGRRRFRRWLEQIQDELGSRVNLLLAMQTNATLIDDDWARLLADYNVEVGVSIDGPAEINDRHRVDFAGRGSHAKVVAGIEHLRNNGVSYSILSVIQLGADGVAAYRHFADLGPGTINFLFPDYTHDDFPAEVTTRYGPHPVADYMLPVADLWYSTAGELGDVPLLRNLCRIILGGQSRSDMFGNSPLGFTFIEVDGEIEGLDVLRVDGEGIFATGLNVLTDDFAAIGRANRFHADAIFNGLPIPTACRSCPEHGTCAGGYLPHRFSRITGFDNPSVWCTDILMLLGHLRDLIGVDPQETELRRMVLADMAEEAACSAWT